MAFFEKHLSPTDVSKRLSVPTRSLHKRPSNPTRFCSHKRPSIPARSCLHKRPSNPTRFCLPFFEGLINEGSHAVDLKVEDDNGKLMTFCCSTRKRGYKKPVFTRGWNSYVRRKKLKVGDKIIFRQLKDGGSVYKIEAQRRISFLGREVWCNVPDA